jgi:hypothetical protein
MGSFYILLVMMSRENKRRQMTMMLRTMRILIHIYHVPETVLRALHV